MNAVHPVIAEENTVTTPSWPNTAGTVRLLRRLLTLYLLAASALIAAGLTMHPLAAEARQSGLLGVAVAGLTLAAAGLAACLIMAQARHRAGTFDPDALSALGRMARRPQGVVIPVLTGLAMAAAWAGRAHAPDLYAQAALLGGGMIVLTFPLLVAERMVAGLSPLALPEAPSLQALMFVPVLTWPLAGTLHILGSLGLPWAGGLMAVPALITGVAALELMVRSLAVWFMLPPSPLLARAAIASLSAALLQPGRLAGSGLASPVQTHLGIDFSRSWALRYLSGAVLPVAALVALLAWGLTGVALVPLDRRAVYERLGVPASIWQPGLHAGLPWPLGQARIVEMGVVHAVPLGASLPGAAGPAEAFAPEGADRLWDQPHPGEIALLTASQGSTGEQGFQSVNVDLTVLYRFALDDHGALEAAYAQNDPDQLVRSEASRLLVQLCAGRTLDSLLGEDRASVAGGVGLALGQELERLGSGIELLGIEIEAIHPPASAASAYHAVQAAGIVASTAIATEAGRAQAAASLSRQQAATLMDEARASGAEAVGAAEVGLRQFTADHAADSEAFRLERTLANLSSALPRMPLIIIDHRLQGASAPVIDLRPGNAPSGAPADE